MNELIVVKQLPVIEEHLKKISAGIDEKVALAESLFCSEDTVKQVKAMRAELNKESAELEAQRMSAKKAVMAPYNAFEAIYKQYVSDKYKAADAMLKERIATVEDELKRRKRDALCEWFDEYRLSKGVDFANIDTWGPNITLSVTLPALKKEGKAYIDRICDDLAFIETQEHKAETLVEYRRSFDVTAAVMTVRRRHEEIDMQKARQAELEARKAQEAETVKRVEAAVPPPLAPPTVSQMETVEDDPMRTLSFKVTAPLSKLRALKKFLDDGGYGYE